MASSDRDGVRRYYASFGPKEWKRLEQPTDGAIEFALTTRALERHLQGELHILDVGGGPGRYAIWLAQHGHTVSLADLSTELLTIAHERISEANVAGAVHEIVEADSCDLSRWRDHAFDAALCLGPFYHLTALGDREVAANELARVVRPGGLAFVALMPRYAFIRRTLCVPDERHHLLDREWTRRLLEDGVFTNDMPGRFTSGYGVRPEAVEPFFREHGFQQVELLAAEGLTSGVANLMGDIIEEGGPLSDVALELIAATAADPSLLGTANHLLYVGRRI